MPTLALIYGADYFTIGTLRLSVMAEFGYVFQGRTCISINWRTINNVTDLKAGGNRRNEKFMLLTTAYRGRIIILVNL